MIEEIQKQHLEAIEEAKELITLKGMMGSEYRVDSERASKECTKVTLQAIINEINSYLFSGLGNKILTDIMLKRKEQLNKQLKDIQ